MKLASLRARGDQRNRSGMFANPRDIRFDLHTFVEYALSHEIKRGHRDNRVPRITSSAWRNC